MVASGAGVGSGAGVAAGAGTTGAGAGWVAVTGGGGGSSPPPQQFWAVEFAMSEFSAGQWQAKQTYDQRMFIIKNIESTNRAPRPFGA